MRNLLGMRRPRGVIAGPLEVSGELARQLLVGGEGKLGDQASAAALDPRVARRGQTPQLGLKAGPTLVSTSQGVADAERVMRAGQARVCYKLG
jgi:hypothetical protein